MSFISSFHDKYKDKIIVWERIGEKRVIKELSAPYYFYVPDKLGEFTAITGEPLKKLSFRNKSDFEQAVMSHPKRFESDLNPLEKCMMDVYAGLAPPKLVYGFVDIEVDYDPAIGWPRTDNPYAPVNALTLYKTDTQRYTTWAVPPKGWSRKNQLPQELLDDNYVLCTDEQELLSLFLEELESIDVISGWNSEFFDLPYLGKRLEMLFGNLGLKKLGFDRAPPPRWGEAERFKGGSKEIVLDLMSRVHLDYMRLFKKFNLEGRQSHALAAIADDELDIPKLHYDGSLYELYRGEWRPNLKSLKPKEDIVIPAPEIAESETVDAVLVPLNVLAGTARETVIKGGWDELYTAQVEREELRQALDLEGLSDEEHAELRFAFEAMDDEVKKLSFIKFIVYNRRDVEIIVKLDQKFKYLDLANAMVHEATVNFGSIFGSVQLIDTAIINFCHLQLKKIVFDRTHRPKQQVEGALVMSPVVGLHRWCCSVDIKSLYPSTYRLLNLSPEKIVGQLMGYEADWRAIEQANKYPLNDLLQNKKVILRLEGLGPEDDLMITAREMIDLLVTKKYAVSGYGTILDQGNGEGLIPAVLTYWFNGRIDMQREKKKFEKKAETILTANKNDKSDLAYLEAIAQAEYYDMLQGVRKVLLNSSYGATLNEFCRFHDPRLGASTTGSGRQITTHMIETIAISLIGDNAPKLIKTIEIDPKTGENINTYTMNSPYGLGPIYSDTDSCYFSVANLVDNDLDSAIAVADAVTEKINESFPEFTQRAFFCQPEFCNKITANREMVAESGIFRAKKKYIMYVRDMEGKRVEPDSPKALKTQGSDIKISSTPEMIRGMLKNVTMMILKGVNKKIIDDYIIKFRSNLNNIENNDLNILEFASVTSVKTYDKYFTQWERIEKPGVGRVGMPANVRSAINYNHFIKERSIPEAKSIMAGDKIKMLWLRENEYGFTNFAFSSDVEELPRWFTDNFEVDLKATEQKLIDQKLKNIFDPVGWEVPTLKTQLMNKLIEF